MRTVSPEGSVFIEPRREILNHFDNLSLTCFSQGGPNNTYQWAKDGIDLANETFPELFVPNVNASDGGQYSCIVSNAAGMGRFDSVLYITPYIVLDPEEMILTTNSSLVSFECEAESFPSPTYIWRTTDSLLDSLSTAVSDGPVVRFEPVVFGDEGYYFCVAFISVNMSNHTAMSQAGQLTSEGPF